MNSRVTRRGALAAGVTAAAGLISCSRQEDSADGNAPVPKGDDNKSWVGKTVMPKKPDPTAYVPSPDPKAEAPAEAAIALRGASWEVKAEKGTRVQVFENGIAYWLEKDAIVVLADAVEFSGKSMKSDQPTGYEYNFRGWAKYLLGKPEEALKDFDEFLKLYPAENGGTPARQVGLSNRGLVLAEMGKFDAAIKDLDEAVSYGHVPAQLNRGWAYELKGDFKKARDDYNAILSLRPADALALNNLAWLSATCPDATFRDGKLAVKLAKLVCELGDNREGTHLDTLAAAHAEAGDFVAAVKAQELALEDTGFAKKYGEDAQKRLQLYKDKKPYRTTPMK